MFALQPKPTFIAEVVLSVPGGGEGKFKAIFKHKNRTELQAFFAKVTDKETPMTDLDAVLDIMSGWEGVDQKFSKENVELMLENYFRAAATILDTYSTAVFEAKQKN